MEGKEGTRQNSVRIVRNPKVIQPLFIPFSMVRLDLANGSNTLILSVEGIRSDGRKGRDTDRLTFIVPMP